MSFASCITSDFGMIWHCSVFLLTLDQFKSDSYHVWCSKMGITRAFQRILMRHFTTLLKHDRRFRRTWSRSFPGFPCNRPLWLYSYESTPEKFTDLELFLKPILCHIIQLSTVAYCIWPLQLHLPWLYVLNIGVSSSVPVTSAAPLDTSVHMEPSSSEVPLTSAISISVPLYSVSTDVHSLVASLTSPIPRHPNDNWPLLPPSVHDWKLPPEWEERLGEPYQVGTWPPPSIALAVGQRLYVDLDTNDVIVSFNSHFEVLPPSSVFQFAAAYSECLDTCRFVLEMRFNGHDFSIDSGQRRVQTVCRGWARRRIHFGSRGAAGFCTFGDEIDMPLVPMSENIFYKRRLTRMLRHIPGAILDGNLLQDSVLPDIDLCYFDYTFPSAWFTHRCAHFQDPLHFEHRFRKRISPAPLFVPWHFVEAYVVPICQRSRFYFPADCPDWWNMETHRALLVPTPPVFSYYSSWAFEGDFCRLIFSVAMIEFAVSAALQFLLVASEGVTTAFGLDNRVIPGKTLLVALRTKSISLIDPFDLREVIYDSHYYLGAAMMPGKQWSLSIGFLCPPFL